MASEARYHRLKTETASAGKFAIVGILATLTHAAVAGGLLQSGALPPLASNLCGYLVAFWVSFSGHYYWSFSHLRRDGTALRTILKFLIVSISGFLLNSTILTLWLMLTPWPEMAGLMFSIAIVPALTFLAARLWVFSHPPAET
ncbi:GtrA family protein [Rhodobacterales bacterium]|nr:GtrA family protein [Rhodobacterales bacterium]